MKIQRETRPATGIRFSISGAARTGLGTALVKEVIAAAREAGCYKLIATSRASRPRVHELYEGLGFANYGLEFRLTFGSGD